MGIFDFLLTISCKAMPTSPKLLASLMIALLGLISLTGCSFFADFFVLNTTSKEVTLSIKFLQPISAYAKDSLSIQLKYADTILTVNDHTAVYLTKKLSYQQIGIKTISIIIPAKSTVLIGGVHNRPLSTDSITIVKNEVATNYAIKDVYQQTKKSGGLFPPFHTTYKIE
jgi:hypothetical protein